jgi:hypothetical protein
MRKIPWRLLRAQRRSRWFMSTSLQRLETVCRYFICALMLVYGLVKIFHGQFYTDEYWKDTPLGQLSGMQLVWSFYSYSPIYETFLGVIEVIVGLLVLFKRTTALGIVLFLPIMANLVVINIIYNVGARGTAVPLLLAGIILLLLHFRSLKRYFWDRDETISRRTTALRTFLPKAIVILVGCGLGAVILYNNKLRFRSDPEIKGAWTFAENSPIQRIYFEKGRTCVIKDEAGELHFAKYQTEANKSLTVTEDNSLLNWQKLPYQIENDLLVLTAKSGKQLLRRQHSIHTPLLPDSP